MQAIRIETVGGPEVLQTVDVAEPAPGPGEVTIRQSAIGINFIDVYHRLGVYPRDLPFIPGREGAGVVEAVGAEADGFRPGMRVAYCDAPRLGGYAEVNAVPARYAVAIPDDLSDDIACAAMLQGLTAQYLVTDSHRIVPGDRVLIHAAAGGVGRLLVQMAKRAGATVIATAGGASKVELARSAGADHVIDYRNADFEPEVRRLTDGTGVDAVYDSVGKDTWERSLRSLRPRGSFVLFGASSGPVPPIDPQRLSMAGSVFFSRPTLTHFVQTRAELDARAADVFAAIRSGALDVRIGERTPLPEASHAHRKLEARATTGKLLLIP